MNKIIYNFIFNKNSYQHIDIHAALGRIFLYSYAAYADKGEYMESNMCTHHNMRSQSFFAYCLDCGEVFKAAALCRHNNLKNHDSFVRCEDCCEILFRDGEAWFSDLAARSY